MEETEVGLTTFSMYTTTQPVTERYKINKLVQFKIQKRSQKVKPIKHYHCACDTAEIGFKM